MGGYDTVCSECGKSLEGRRKGTKTCGAPCRRKRSSRLAAETAPGDLDLAKQVLRREAPDIAHDVIQDEIRPIIREALTEEVLDSIQRMVGLTPKMIDAIERDLDSADETIRQKAYTLLARYTIGHEKLVPDKPDEAKKLVVQFEGMPRPVAAIEAPQLHSGDELLVDGELPNVRLEDTLRDPDPPDRICAACGVTKTADNFVGTSDRCYVCHNELADRANAILNPPSAE